MHRAVYFLGCLSVTALLAGMTGVAASAHGIILGINTHVTTGQPRHSRAQLDVARTIGFDAVRDGFLWQYAEQTKGIYKIPAAWDQYVNESRKRGLQPLVILCYGNKFYDNGDKPRSLRAIESFVHYATFVTKHFAGRVRYFEVWNEWNTHTGGHPSGSARDYAKLFDTVYPAVKKADPDAVVLAAAGGGGKGNNDWYEKIARLGVAELADGVSIHPYIYPQRPNTGSSVGSNEAERSAQQVINAEAIMRRLSGGKEIPLYITEIGWSNNIGKFGLTEAGVVSMAPRALLLFSALPFVRGVWWYDLRDGCSNRADKDCRMAVVRHDLSLEPVAYAIKSVAPLVEHNALTLSPAADLDAGLVVLKRNFSSAPSIIAWYVGHNTSAPKEPVGGGGFAAICSPSLKVMRTSRDTSTSELTFTAKPTIFTYRSGHCTRKRLFESVRSPNR